MRSFAFALLLLLGAPALARANTDKLLYAHQSSCPDRAAFVAALSERGANLATLAEHTTLSVAVAQVGGEYVGSLSVSEGSPTGSTDERPEQTMNEGAETPSIEPKFIRGASCEGVVDALAAMTALAISSRPKDATPPTSKPTNTKPTPEQQLNGGDARPAPAPYTPPPTVFRHHQQPPQWWGERPEHRARFYTAGGTTYLTDLPSLTLSGGLTYGLLPNTIVPQFDLVYKVASFLTVPDGRQTLVNLMTVRIGWFGPVNFARRPTVGVEVVGLELAYGLCTGHYFASDSWSFHSCGELGGGFAYTAPYNTDDSTFLSDRYLPFGLGGASVTTEYHLNSWLHVGLTFGYELRWLNNKTEVVPGTKLGPFSGFTRAGLGINW